MKVTKQAVKKRLVRLCLLKNKNQREEIPQLGVFVVISFLSLFSPQGIGFFYVGFDQTVLDKKIKANQLDCQIWVLIKAIKLYVNAV